MIYLLTLGDNFSYQGAKPLDARLIYSTVASMKAVADSTMYDGCMAYCTATDKTYQWKSTNTVDETTGKWREYSGGSSLPTGGTTGQVLAKKTNTNYDVEWTDISGLEYEEKTLVSSNNSYNNANLVSNGETKIFHSYWEAGLTVSDPHLPNCESNAIARHFYIEMTKASDGLSFTQRCRVLYTKSNVNYVRVYDRRCTSDGTTWTYPDWTEEGQNLDAKYDIDDTASTDITDADYFPFYDTSANAKKKSLWSNIVDKLKTTFQQKLTAGANISINSTTNKIDASYPLMVNEFDKANLYSTTEKVIGSWTDGRPLYQKTVSWGLITSGNNSKNHNISNINAITDCKGYWVQDNTYFGPIGERDAGNATLYVYADKTKISFVASSEYGDGKTYAYITLQYTKTTDAANSFNYASENDYSTTEKIVGTWIDGKPLYQKTINFGQLPNNNKKTVAHSISNLKRVISFDAYIAHSSGANYIMPLPYNDKFGNIVYLYREGTTIAIETSSDMTAYTECYITIKYTKTTD